MIQYPQNRTAPGQFAQVINAGTATDNPGFATYFHVVTAANVTATLAGKTDGTNYDTMVLQPGTGEVIYPFSIRNFVVNSGSIDYCYAIK